MPQFSLTIQNDSRIALLPWMARICLTLLCVVPFIVPFHTEPIATFYSEWVAIACGIGGLFALAGATGLAVPRIAWAPLGLAGVVLMHALFGSTGQRFNAMIAVLYLVWAGMLVIAVRRLCDYFTREQLAKGFAVALLAAALINATSVILFHLELRLLIDVPFLRPDLRGDLAQVNHVASVLWIGVASALYLWHSLAAGWPRFRYLLLLCLPPLLLASAFTGARAPLVYVLWLPLVFYFFRQLAIVRVALPVALLYGATVWLVHYLQLHNLTAGSDTISRLMAAADGSSGFIRLGLIAMAGSMIAVHPLLGNGWASFSWESYQRAGPHLDWLGAAEHTHQLFFQLAAELGVPVALGVAWLLGLWLLGLLRIRKDDMPDEAGLAWTVAAAGIILLHAQIEYPLWYAHFLGVCALLLGLSERRVVQFPALRFSLLSMSLVWASCLFMLGQAFIDYRALEGWLYGDVARANKKVEAGHYTPLATLYESSILRAKAGLLLAAVMPPTPELLDDKRKMCERVLVIEPQRPTVFTCALLDELAGETELAEQRWRKALWVFRAEAPAYLDNLLVTLPEDVLRKEQRLINMARIELAKPPR